MTTAMWAALSSRWLASRLVVKGRNETKSRRTRLRPIITWSAALVNRVRLLCAIQTPPMKAKLTKYPR